MYKITIYDIYYQYKYNKVAQVLLFLLPTLVLIQIIIALNLLLIFSLLFSYRKAQRAESRNSKSQSRASSKVSKSKVELSPVYINEEEEAFSSNKLEEMDEDEEKIRHYK